MPMLCHTVENSDDFHNFHHLPIHVLCSKLLQGVHVGHALAPAAPAHLSRDASRVRGLRAEDVDSLFFTHFNLHIFDL